MKIGAIIPDRNDRPEFLKNCKRMLAAQTVRFDKIELVNYKAKKKSFDLVDRYETGYNLLKDVDLVFFIENDDWYSPRYVEKMLKQYIIAGQPNIFGTGYSIYYHLKRQVYMQMNHDGRASAFNTVLKSNMKIDWGDHRDPFLDLHLWRTIKGTTFNPITPISIGIKHGIGLCGGMGHSNDLQYSNKDINYMFLRNKMDSESYNFYTQLFR